VAGVGLGEREAADQGVDVDVARLSLDQVPRALAARDTRGFIKLLRERETDRLVGARIVAPEGGELVMQVALALRSRMTVRDLAVMLHPYLTMSEGVKALSCCV